MKYTAVVGGERLELTLIANHSGSIKADVGDRKYEIEITNVQSGVYWVNWNGQSLEVAITLEGDGYLVSVNGEPISVEILDPRAALRKAGQFGEAGAVQVRAPMPGKVVRLLVAEGETVTANQGLLVIEAMKMQNEMKSPKAGVVKKIAVKEGSVNAGDLLAVVE